MIYHGSKAEIKIGGEFLGFAAGSIELSKVSPSPDTVPMPTECVATVPCVFTFTAYGQRFIESETMKRAFEEALDAVGFDRKGDVYPG